MIPNYDSSEEEAPVQNNQISSKFIYDEIEAPAKVEKTPTEDEAFEREYRLLNESIAIESQEQEVISNSKGNNASFRSSPVSNFNSVAEGGSVEDIDDGEKGAFSNLSSNNGIHVSQDDSEFKLADDLNPSTATTTEKVKRILLERGLLTVSLPDIDVSLAQQPSDSLREKIVNWTGFRDRGLFFNAKLFNSHDFRNPLIMNKMLEFMKLDSHASNLPKVMYDPSLISSLPHYEALVSRKLPVTSSSIKYTTGGNSSKSKAIEFKSSSYGKKREGPYNYGGPRKRL